MNDCRFFRGDLSTLQDDILSEVCPRAQRSPARVLFAHFEAQTRAEDCDRGSPTLLDAIGAAGRHIALGCADRSWGRVYDTGRADQRSLSPLGVRLTEGRSLHDWQ